MIEIRNDNQDSFFGNYIYDKIISKEHILRKINETIDFSFINVKCNDLYSLNAGRPAWSPVLMFKILFLQFLYNLSDYAIEDELNDRLSFKMFIGLEIEETPPDHSTISRFRDRLGVERFKDIFNHIVGIARSKGVISDKLHIVDSTDIRAKVDLYRIKKKYKESEPDTYIDNHSPDKDARPGRKHKGKQFYGYKAHCLVDAESEILLNVETTPGNIRDYTEFKSLLEQASLPKVVAADRGYDCSDNHQYLSKNNIRNGIAIKNNHTKTYLKRCLKRVSKVAKKFRYIIERKHSEMKNRHGLRNAKFWGIAKVRIQVYLTATVTNIKRMVNILYGLTSPPIVCLRCVKS